MLGQRGEGPAKRSLTRAFFQVYMFKCVWRCYKFMKYLNSAEERSGSKMLQKVSLVGVGVGVRSQPCHTLCHLGQASLPPWGSVSPL